MIISHSIFLRMKNFSNNSCRENKKKKAFYVQYFFFIMPFMTKYEKNIVQSNRQKTRIWLMPFACMIPKPINTNSDYVTLIAFPLQQWLYETASMLRYIGYST